MIRKYRHKRPSSKSKSRTLKGGLYVYNKGIYVGIQSVRSMYVYQKLFSLFNQRTHITVSFDHFLENVRIL